jgi:hypothetical protein
MLINMDKTRRIGEINASLSSSVFLANTNESLGNSCLGIKSLIFLFEEDDYGSIV